MNPPHRIDNVHDDVLGYDPERPHLTPSWRTKHAVVIRDRRFVPARILVEMGLEHSVFQWFDSLVGRRFESITLVATQEDLYADGKKLLRYYYEVISSRFRRPGSKMHRIVEPELVR